MEQRNLLSDLKLRLQNKKYSLYAVVDQTRVKLGDNSRYESMGCCDYNITLINYMRGEVHMLETIIEELESKNAT